jgi:hypothetical protein
MIRFDSIRKGVFGKDVKDAIAARLKVDATATGVEMVLYSLSKCSMRSSTMAPDIAHQQAESMTGGYKVQSTIAGHFGIRQDPSAGRTNGS